MNEIYNKFGLNINYIVYKKQAYIIYRPIDDKYPVIITNNWTFNTNPVSVTWTIGQAQAAQSHIINSGIGSSLGKAFTNTLSDVQNEINKLHSRIVHNQSQLIGHNLKINENGNLVKDEGNIR